MINIDYTWLGIGGGALFLLAAYMLKSKSKSLPNDYQDKKNSRPEVAFKTPIQESIRQIALIEKDEFDKFYRPVIHKVQQYEELLPGEKSNQIYFETVFKALRKRRSAIFEFGSSEQDQQKKALWTFALFAAISIRYIVQRLSEFSCSLNGNLVIPTFLNLNELRQCELILNKVKEGYQSDLSNIHLIDKVLAANVIQHFNQAGVYPFLINAVSGFYQERINPFYTIIEQVENHVKQIPTSERSIFLQSLEHVLNLVERDTFSKNQANSMVFEGMSYLLIDRNFLWELYRGYAVSYTQPLGKKEFEADLIKNLQIPDNTNKNIVYTISVELKNMDNSPEKSRIKLSNMLALPYKAVPFYRYKDRKRIEKRLLHREVVVDDSGGLTGQEIVSANVDKQSGNRSVSQTSMAVGVKDLFGGQQ